MVVFSGTGAGFGAAAMGCAAGGAELTTEVVSAVDALPARAVSAGCRGLDPANCEPTANNPTRAVTAAAAATVVARPAGTGSRQLGTAGTRGRHAGRVIFGGVQVRRGRSTGIGTVGAASVTTACPAA